MVVSDREISEDPFKWADAFVLCSQSSCRFRWGILRDGEGLMTAKMSTLGQNEKGPVGAQLVVSRLLDS